MDVCRHPMKKQTTFFAAALLTAGSLLTACSNDDMAVENPMEQTAKTGEITFTATIAPKDGTATTRSVDADGVTTWVENEQIAVYYQKTDDSYGTSTANVDEVNDGKATISALLSDAKDGGEVKFVYPATIVNDTGDNIDATKLAAQHGTIDDISDNFDAATGSGTLVTDGSTCGTSATVTMTNQVLIGKFTPKFGGSAIDGITTLTVTDGTNTYTVTPTSGTFGTSGIYVAMLPVDDKEVIVTAATATQSYGYGGKKITLAVGTLYDNLAIAMGKLVNLTGRTSDYTAEDGEFVTGSLTNHNVTIPDGYKVTLSNVTLDRSTDNAGPVICSGNNTITLSGVNSVKRTGTQKGYTAIHPGASGKTLTIKGCGQLTATTVGQAAAIGGGRRSGSCGNIRIEGGEITVQSNEYGAGIGAAANTGTISCGDITITGGHVVASIPSGSGTSGTGIGCYSYTNQVTCGNITISGGKVEATGGTNGAGIGSGTVSNAATKCGSITISGGTVIANGGQYATGIGGGNGGSSCDDITINGTADVTATGYVGGAGIGIYTGTCGNISISGTAKVTATGNAGGAGIGCGYRQHANTKCGNISISESANVTAIGRQGAAGIGSGRVGDASSSNICGTITISGGTVVATAESTYDATPVAGIGTGYGTTCGSISITGGTVTATKSPSSYSNYSDIGVGQGGSIKEGEADGTITVASTVKTDTGKGYVVNSTYGYNQEP